MRTNIDIDDELMDEAVKRAGVMTGKEAVNLGLKTLVPLQRRQRIRRYRGKPVWEGELEHMRLDRSGGC